MGQPKRVSTIHWNKCNNSNTTGVHTSSSSKTKKKTTPAMHNQPRSAGVHAKNKEQTSSREQMGRHPSTTKNSVRRIHPLSTEVASNLVAQHQAMVAPTKNPSSTCRQLTIIPSDLQQTKECRDNPTLSQANSSLLITG